MPCEIKCVSLVPVFALRSCRAEPLRVPSLGEHQFYFHFTIARAASLVC